MPPNSTPQWQSISALPTIGSLIDEMLANAEEHYETIQQAKGRPYVFDDAIIARIVQVHTDQLQDHGVYGCMLLEFCGFGSYARQVGGNCVERGAKW